jgi:hypothetical protein
MNAQELSILFCSNTFSHIQEVDRVYLQEIFSLIWHKACEAQKNHTGAVLQDGKIRIYHTTAEFNIDSL